MIGAMLVIFLLLPESPWWLAGQEKLEKAAKVLLRFNGHVPGYNVDEVIVSLVQRHRTRQASADPYAVNHDRHDRGRATCRQARQAGRLVCRLSRPKSLTLLHRRLAEGHPAICRPERVQHLFDLLLYVVRGFRPLLRTDDYLLVQAAGNKNPFLVTVILCCVQIISMLTTSLLTDTIGRRPLTVYPYAVTVVSVLCLGIVGCYDYSTKALSSLLVSRKCFLFLQDSGSRVHRFHRSFLLVLPRSPPPVRRQSGMRTQPKSLSNDCVHKQRAGHFPSQT